MTKFVSIIEPFVQTSLNHLDTESIALASTLAAILLAWLGYQLRPWPHPQIEESMFGNPDHSPHRRRSRATEDLSDALRQLKRPGASR